MTFGGVVRKVIDMRTKTAATSSTRIVMPCPKCQGHGVICRFSHQHQGVCYDCNGAGTIRDFAPIVSEPTASEQLVTELGVTFGQVARWLDEAAYSRTATTYNMEDPERYSASKTADSKAFQAQMAMTYPEQVAFAAFLQERNEAPR